MSDQAIADAFNDNWNEFGEDVSTEFLLQITADRCGIDYDRVVDALGAIYGNEA